MTPNARGRTVVDDLMARLRRAPALAGPLPRFDPATAGDRPGPVFADWLGRALDDEVPEPQVMTLSTADAAGRPSARVLVLRGFDPAECSFDFATDAASRKGGELAVNPYAALTWYWPAHGRQIRAAGPVTVLDRQHARDDFLGRGEASRVAGFTGTMSAPLAGAEAYDEGRARAREVLAATPDAVPDGHTVHRLRPDEVEFFQGSGDRFHRRLRYVRDGDGWRRGELWP
ncbi:pyridoxamine 5'-phosphate oxidase family protein [Streptantibioticus parmotrematis]|uniref:pyridoxine/pyridoxamine 5'-phosphate oxidase n=1 Tax=Streptantibioticus parmotrematis TaxID=2873249 RepID=UPI0033D47103